MRARAGIMRAYIDKEPPWPASTTSSTNSFVITAQMLRMTPQQFDSLALEWMEDGGPGFDVAGIPHRVVIDGQFYIGRITVQRHGDPA